MTPQETCNLAKATCCWLAYKDLTGFQRMLSESTLTLPVAEFLTSQTAWLLQSELYYQKLPGADALPDFWCDFAATRKGGNAQVQFILEAKYLRIKAENMRRQIVADFVRLSMPPGKALKRFFLLAGESQYFSDSSATFLFDKALFGMKVGNGYYIKPRDELAKPHLAKASSSFKDKNFGDFSLVPNSAYVTCRAVEEVPGNNKNYKVMIWSVGLAKDLVGKAE
jgi:hypothetical protein